jgi:hypothetical protein
MTIGKGSLTQPLTSGDVEQLLAEACEALPVDGKRVLVIIPDGTRTAPIPLFFRLLYEQLGQRVAQLDYLIALGTHPPLSEEAIDQLVGVSAVDRAEHYPKVRIFNHCFQKHSQTWSSLLDDIFVPASQQKGSLAVANKPELPAPQANFCPDEATAETPVIRRSASSLIF